LRDSREKAIHCADAIWRLEMSSFSMIVDYGSLGNCLIMN
jgi:hypothetical protein